MLRYIQIIIAGILTSFYFFPFKFSFFMGMNTKMIMAGFGLGLLGFNMAKRADALLDHDIFKLTILALLVSLVGLASTIINGTHDYTYASYIISMWVWLSAAYVVITVLRKVHGYVSVELVCNYLVGVVTAQCCIAFMMDQIPVLKNFVDSFLGSMGSMGKVENRLYGIGAALDVAGSRFSAVLVVIAYLVKKYSNTYKEKYIPFYLLAFFIVVFIGNMIARSTIVGAGISLVYWFFAFGLYRLDFSFPNRKFYTSVLVLLIIFIPVVYVLYNVNPNVYNNMHFAFEGFFSLAEKGTWEVHSNEILKTMYVFPDNFKTWIIGDGYFDNPYYSDPYFTGSLSNGFYMGTDVGYLRFIFYFGIIGLFSFFYYMCQVGLTCIHRFTSYKVLFMLVLLVNFSIWFKVSTDIFLFFALFLCVSQSEQDMRLKDEDSIVI